jgi:hypothetical protein
MDWSWIRAGFFLKWFPLDSSNASNHSCTTLICFGASISLQQRFERLASNSTWTDAVCDPYNLFVIILDELFIQADGLVWNLSDVFRAIEEVSTVLPPLLVHFQYHIDADRKRSIGPIPEILPTNWILSVCIMWPSTLST